MPDRQTLFTDPLELDAHMSKLGSQVWSKQQKKIHAALLIDGQYLGFVWKKEAE